MFSKIKYENKLVKETNRKLGKFVSFTEKGEEQGVLDIFLLEPKKESVERYKFRSSFYAGKISEDISKTEFKDLILDFSLLDKQLQLLEKVPTDYFLNIFNSIGFLDAEWPNLYRKGPGFQRLRSSRTFRQRVELSSYKIFIDDSEIDSEIALFEFSYKWKIDGIYFGTLVKLINAYNSGDDEDLEDVLDLFGELQIDDDGWYYDLASNNPIREEAMIEHELIKEQHRNLLMRPLREGYSSQLKDYFKFYPYGRNTNTSDYELTYKPEKIDIIKMNRHDKFTLIKKIILEKINFMMMNHIKYTLGEDESYGVNSHLLADGIRGIASAQAMNFFSSQQKILNCKNCKKPMMSTFVAGRKNKEYCSKKCANAVAYKWTQLQIRLEKQLINNGFMPIHKNFTPFEFFNSTDKFQYFYNEKKERNDEYQICIIANIQRSKINDASHAHHLNEIEKIIKGKDKDENLISEKFKNIIYVYLDVILEKFSINFYVRNIKNNWNKNINKDGLQNLLSQRMLLASLPSPDDIFDLKEDITFDNNDIPSIERITELYHSQDKSLEYEGLNYLDKI